MYFFFFFPHIYYFASYMTMFLAFDIGSKEAKKGKSSYLYLL